MATILRHKKIKYLILSLTNGCNLKCKYCYRGDGGNSVITPSIIDHALTLIDPHERVHVQITGGEPLLHIDLVSYAGKTIRDKFKKATLGIQTNGTLVDNAFIEIAKKYDMQVGVSIDGRKDINDFIRGGSSQVYAALGMLDREGVEFRTTTVISNLNVDHIHEIPIILSAFNNARGIAFDMLVKKELSIKHHVYLPDTKRLEVAVERLMKNLNFVNTMRRVPIQLRELNKLNDRAKSGAFCHAETGESLAVTSTGELYPCSQVMGDSTFYMGNIFEFSQTKLPMDRSSILFMGGDEGCSGSCWDCPSRKYYNRFEENAPDFFEILGNIIGNSGKEERLRRTI